MNICPVGTELFHADVRTDRRTDVKLIVAFRNFANAPKHFFHLFDVHVTVHRDKFLKIKPTRCTNFSNLF